jgi:quercetin dioxygenase-like cupin family protein
MKRSPVCLVVSVFVMLLLSAACQPIQLPAAPEPAIEMAAREVSVPFAAIQVINDFVPGAWHLAHWHGGPGLFTVLEGELTLRDEETGEETTYAAGESWIEEIGHVYAVGNEGQEKARIGIVFLLPEGASMRTDKEGTSTGDLPPGPTPVYRTTMTMTASLGNFEAIQVINDFAPGAWTPPHWHGGPVLLTVLEGELTLRDEETGEETTYAAGESWIEEIGHVMAVGNEGEVKARVAIIFLLPEGASLTTGKDGTATDALPPGPTPVYRTSMPVATAAE